MADVEHVGHLQLGFGIDSRPHIEARQGDAADDARIGSQGQARPEAFFGGDRTDDFRDADSQVHDIALLQFHGGPAGTDLAVVQGMGRQGLDGLAPFAAQFRPVAMGRKALDVILRPRYDDVVDEEMMNLHEARIEASPGHDVFDLDDDDAAGIMRRFGHFQLFTDHGFALEGNVAVFIGQGAADEADLDGKGRIIQVFAAIDFHQADDVLPFADGLGVGLAAVPARVGQGMQADVGPDALTAGGNSPVQFQERPSRDRIGQALVSCDLIG